MSPVISDAKEIESNLLNYLKKELDDPEIVYKTPPTRLLKGSETLIFLFQIQTRQKEFNKPLVLRIYPEYAPLDLVGLESFAHSILADEGLPVPRSHFICLDESILNGAFFIIDFLPGKNLATEPVDIRFRILGEAHAALHKTDPNPVINALNKQGIDENRYTAEAFIKPIEGLPNAMPWIRDAVIWVLDNRQKELETPAIFHGDFHANNILIHDGQISGILDWHLCIADPAYDVARTVQVYSVLNKNFAPEHNWALLERNTRKYLNAYQSVLPLDDSKLIFGRVVFCLFCIFLGAIGSPIMRHPAVLYDEIEFIHKITGIRLPMPDWVNKNTAPI